MKYPLFKVLVSEQAQQRVAEVLKSGYLGQGEKVAEFEQLFSNLLHSNVVALNSCTSALHLAFELIKRKSGVGKVLTSPLTCFATTSAILQAGLEPCWVDIDPVTLLMDSQDAEKQLEQHNPVAACFVHFAGRPMHIPNDYKVWIVEDCAHAFGATDVFGFVGSHPETFSCFSFQAVKVLTTGDGGLLKIPSEFYQQAHKLRWYGMDRNRPRNQDIEEAGFKSNMNDYAAALGLGNFQLAWDSVEIQKANALYYHENIVGDGITLPYYSWTSSYWLFPVFVERREDFIYHLASHGIESSPAHYRNDKNSCVERFKRELPGMDSIEQTMTCVPNGWWITEEDRGFITDVINKGW